MKIFVLALAVLFGFVSRVAALDVPQEHRKFIIDRPENRDGNIARLCKAFDLCKSMKFDRSVALVIGISRYAHLRKLETTSADASRVKDFLLNSKEFDQVVLLTEEDATPERINYFMEDYFPELLKSGGRTRFLFYFSGHGTTQSNAGDSSRGYLRLANNRVGEFGQSIRMDTVTQWAQQNISPATHSLFLIDSCVSGLAIPERKKDDLGSLIGRNPVELARYGEGSILTAGTADQDALADKKWNGSLFTYAILEALTNEHIFPNQSDGIITEYQLYDYVQRRVSNESGNRQTPKRYEFKSQKNGDFFFLSPAAVIRVTAGSPILGSETKGTDSIIFEEKVLSTIWNDIKDTTNADILEAFSQQHPGSTYSQLALDRIKQLLASDSKDLPPRQKWEFWKDKGIWRNPIDYCNSLTTFIQQSRRVAALHYKDTHLSMDLNKFHKGMLDGNFFVRSDEEPRSYCGTTERDSDYVAYCARRVSRSALVFNTVYRRTLNDIRSCIRPLGWHEFTSKDVNCSVTKVGASDQFCSHGFQMGPQAMWLYTFQFEGADDEGKLYAIGVQIQLKSKSRPTRVIQGDYQFFSPDRVVVRASATESARSIWYDSDGRVLATDILPEKEHYEYIYGSRTGSVSKIERSKSGKLVETIFVNYASDENISEISSSRVGTVAIQYERLFHKPGIIILSGVDKRVIGRLIVTYDSNAKISSVRSEPPSVSKTIAEIFNGFLDMLKWAE